MRRDPARYESVRERFRLPPLKGVMLCGVSGGGKSMLAKLVAREFNLALLRLDVGALFGQYVGESEERTRKALHSSAARSASTRRPSRRAWLARSVSAGRAASCSATSTCTPST